MTQLISIFCQYFDREIPRLETTFRWKIPGNESFKDFPLAGQGGYHSNLALKQHLKNRWEAANNCDEKTSVAEIIVKDWGGVRRNNWHTLSAYVKGITSGSLRTHLKGIASYSKILAIVDPDMYAIYDARVAACLNAIQINAKVKAGLIFNYVPGRNKVIGNASTGEGFVYDSRFSSVQLQTAGWTPIKRNDTYEKYLELLKQCQNERPLFSLVSFEMALFANAEKECLSAMKNSPGNFDTTCATNN